MEKEKFKIIRTQSVLKVNEILTDFDFFFNPPLQVKISDLKTYARKVVTNGHVYVAIIQGKSIGFISFYTNDNISNIGYLSLIAVNPNFRVRGIGFELIKQFEKISYENKMKILKLEVLDNNHHAHNFYKKNGYEHIGRASVNSSYMAKKI
ncbi:GNAT family N-acetyltransferase [Longirhabdus pacifica]|uniref:GNAT family N-acetyltransferase n=1 Tax=Longirhabdus pacifica TaxID=2305227 RepID=UPI001008BBFB|nr:GNAT family N-acetyltransferase [Longirhabdus pacifica]